MIVLKQLLKDIIKLNFIGIQGMKVTLLRDQFINTKIILKDGSTPLKKQNLHAKLSDMPKF